MKTMIPQITQQHPYRYADYTIQRLCQEMHDFTRQNRVNELQKALFREATMPKPRMDAQRAQFELMRGNAELVPLSETEGRIALEGALPYPPGIICCVPGEEWNAPVRKYFEVLAESINRFPGFAPELQGVYVERGQDGVYRAYANVLKESRRRELEDEGVIVRG